MFGSGYGTIEIEWGRQETDDAAGKNSESIK